jgi:hypothetical protein
MELKGLKVKKIVLKNVIVINAQNRDSILAEAETKSDGCKGYYNEDDCTFECRGKCQGAGSNCGMDFGLNEETGILEISCGCT